MAAVESVAELTSLLEKWEREHSNSTAVDQVPPILSRMAELVEKETESWYKSDPDPFDDRHPGRADPDCALGHLLKALFKNDNFMSKLVSVYLMSNRDQTVVQTQACRLLLDVMPGLEATVVFLENEDMVRRLFHWAEGAAEPLRTYATGLLAGAMEVQNIAANFRENNASLVPLMLKRLHEIQKETKPNRIIDRPFANIANDFVAHKATNGNPVTSPVPKLVDSLARTADGPLKEESPAKRIKHDSSEGTKMMENRAALRPVVSAPRSPWASPAAYRDGLMADCSNSSWKDLEPYVIGKYCLSPLESDMQQRLILQYLTPMGEYQELLSYVFEHDALQLIFTYIDLSKTKDVRLAFEALKYLAALLCHKKFALEFISAGGVQRLLSVYRPSVAATGVSTCLYYLAYVEDAMERVCMLPPHTLNELIKYVLWLLECSHKSGRCHAIMFFSMSFPFRIILDLFDSHDGLRKLYNVISTQEILNVEESNVYLTEGNVFTSRQATRHVCVALKKYLEVHLTVKTNQIRRAHLRNEGGGPLNELPAYKPTKLSPDVVQGDVEMLLEYQPVRMRWEPVTQIHQLGGITLLLQLIAMAAEWNAYTGKAETIRSALDVLAICAVLPQTQLELCEAVALPDNVSTPAISIILGLAEGEVLIDPDVQKSALSLIINCFCSPMARFSGGVGRFMGGSAKKAVRMKTGEDLLAKMWHAIRSNNGIMVMLKLLVTKTPITEADAIRALACKALVGLIRSDTIKQIISKLPLISDGQLQQLMKEPVLQDKRQEHIKFCKYANEIIERVSGKSQNASIDASLDRIRRADLVAQTKIVYPEKELLQLIYGHLKNIGLHEAASALQKEAELPRGNSPPPIHPASPHIYSTPSTPKLSRQLSSPSSLRSCPAGTSSNPITPQAPIRFNLQNKTQSPGVTPQTKNARRLVRQKPDAGAASTFHSPRLMHQPLKTETSASLDKIVTEYLRKQHATCKNLVVTCPPFSLLNPHRCPDPRNRSSAPLNITARLNQRMFYPPFGGPDGQRCNRKYIYSKFRPIRSYRDTEEDGSFSCCAFSSDEQYLMLGTYTGELKLFQIQTGEENGAYDCHSTPLTHVQPSKDGRLVLTSSSLDTPLSALWNMNDVFDLKHSFTDDHYVEFSKHTQDRVIATEKEKAKIFDIATCQPILTLYDPDKANNYVRNRATFNSTDDLVLNDGVLWDINSGKSVHKFDKFNPNISGVFHPMGLEIIINSEVWDLRSFQLLHTVPALDQCEIRFNHNADVIYGAIRQHDDEDEMNDDANKSPFGSSFRTFDAKDYSQIATIDAKKSIVDMCTDTSDCYLAVIENQKSPETLMEESVCRLYEVGRTKDVEDDQGEDDEDEEDEDMDDDDDDGDDDDDDDDDPEASPADNDDQNDEENANDNSDDGDDDNGGSDDTESELDSTDSDDDDLDDVYFELSDLSQF